MKFRDMFVFRDDRFAVGVVEGEGKYFISIPVANSLVDYEEHYEIDAKLFEECPGNVATLKQLANKCRRRENDDQLILRPGCDRGIAT